MDAFPILQTARLQLGPLAWDDVPTIVGYAGDPDVSKTTLNIPYPYEAKDAIYWINNAYQRFLNQTQYTFAIRNTETEAFMGGIGLRVNQRFNRAELGYWIAKPFWGRGYGTEAAGAVITFGFERLDLHKIHASYLEENPASGKVMQKNGMIREGEMKDHFFRDGAYKSVIQYRLTKAEWLALQP